MARVLSIQNPWASLILAGHKDIETRTWSTNYRGPLYIHFTPDKSHNPNLIYQHKIFRVPSLDTGYIHGVAMLTHIKHYQTGGQFFDDRERHRCNWHPDKLPIYGWILKDARLLEEPILAKGKLGIWRHKIG